MNNFLKIVAICILTSCITYLELSAQVTIGASDAPLPGALLDLKQENNATGGATSQLGLGLPRVKLTDKDNLFPMFTGITEYTGTYKQNQDLLHIGLLVYNVDACTLSGKGMYVWTKNGWEILGDATGGGGLNISPSSLFFYNGLNNQENLTASWAGSGPLTMTENKTGGLNFTSTASGTTSPIKYSVTVPNMDPTELETNPFLLKTGKMTFELSNSPCGVGGIETKDVDIRQINKALILGENSIYTNDATKSGSVTVKSNANWKMTGILPTLNPVELVTVLAPNDLKNGATINWENDLGEQGGNGNISVTVGTQNLNRYNYITLTDAANPKRFADVTLAVLQCAANVNPTMESWRTIAGLDTKPEGVPNEMGVAWHLDQSGNIFLSGKFGNWDNSDNSERRWMITNLAAKDFARVGRTGNDNQVYQEWGTSLSKPPSLAPLNDKPMWGYTSDNADSLVVYNRDQRVGVLYNWTAATNSQNINGPAAATQPGRFSGYNKRQGICPNGWHLPSFSETVDLMNEMMVNSSLYSSSADMYSTPPVGNGQNGKPYDFNEAYNTLQSSTAGISLKDYCSIGGTNLDIDKLKNVATSNPITSTQQPGYNAVFCGIGSGGSLVTAETTAYYWLYNVVDVAVSKSLYFTSTQKGVMLWNLDKKALTSVRCVQDYGL